MLDEDAKRYWDQKAKHDRSSLKYWIIHAKKGDFRACQILESAIFYLEKEENETQMQIDAFKENMSELGKMTMDSKCELDDLLRKLASIQPQKQELQAVIKELKANDIFCD